MNNDLSMKEGSLFCFVGIRSTDLGSDCVLGVFGKLYNWWRMTQTHVVDLGGTRNV